MVQLKILSGKQAGQTFMARRFPFQVGRAADQDLTMDEPGVWDRHLDIHFEAGAGFIATPQGEALLTINGEAVSEQTRLCNGDTIGIGGAQLQFWLGETRQSGLRLREWLVWSGIALVTIVQVALIYWLLQ